LQGGDPLRVFLGEGGFDAFGEGDTGIGRGGVGAGFGQVEEFFVLEGFGGGAVGGPVFLVLVEVEQAFKDGDDHAQASDDVVGEVGNLGEGAAGEERDQGSGDDFDDLDAFEGLAGGAALLAVPGELVVEALEDGVVGLGEADGAGIIHGGLGAIVAGLQRDAAGDL